jgi:hypothetical protein
MSKTGTIDSKKVICIINPYAANKKWQRNALLRKYLQKNLPGRIIDNPEDKASMVEIVKELCSLLPGAMGPSPMSSRGSWKAAG